MAEYGAELYDSLGKRFARVDGGLSYHYWGRVDVPAGDWAEVPLFNIPVSVKICAFIFCEFANENWADRMGMAQVRQINGVWHARVSWVLWPGKVTSFKSASFYIFVPAQYIQSDKYGLQCFNSVGLKVYDSARPLLQIAGLGNGGVLTSGSCSFFNRTPTKTAAPYCSQMSQQFITLSGRAYWGQIFYFGTFTAGALAGYTGMFVNFHLGGSGSNNQPFDNVPLIDAGYYDAFPNLPSM